MKIVGEIEPWAICPRLPQLPKDSANRPFLIEYEIQAKNFIL
jgi:hypothetical protein